MQTRDEFTIGEAAFITGQPARRIHRLFDEGPIKSRARREERASRILRTSDLVFVMVTSAAPLSHLDPAGKAIVYEYICSWCRRSDRVSRRTRPVRLPLGESVDLNWSKVSDSLLRRAAELERARIMVSTDPEIRGGEPVVAGTRIPVQLIHELAEQGMTAEEIQKHYPSLTPAKIRLADIYARAYPRRGRPPRHPWHNRSS